MKSIQGQLLIASPHLSDTNFFRSVVLMVQHDESGALGLILNRPTPQTIQEIWRSISDEMISCEQPVFHGGPVEGPLSALHDNPNWSENEVLPGVHFSAARDHLSQLIRSAEVPFRLFAGYSGWAGGQLESELAAGGWLCAPAKRSLVFGDVDEIWKTAVEGIGQQILQPTVARKHFPSDPSAN